MANVDNIMALNRLDLSNTRTKSVPGHLLQLPSELLLDIIDRVDIVTVAILSKTCARFRALTHRDWQPVLRRFRIEEKLVFWSRLAFDSPDHFVCEICRKTMHRINQEDLPQKNGEPPCRITGYKVNNTLNPYCVRSHHVQMSLKLFRLGSIHQEYLEKLMAPFTWHRQYGDMPPSLQYFAATPKIISGGFFLRKEWKFETNSTCRFEDVRLEIAREPLVCTHMLLRPSLSARPGCDIYWMDHRSRPDLSTEFEYDFLKAAYGIYVGKEFERKCEWCGNRTEYSISCPDRLTMVIRAWYDFGIEAHDDWRSSLAHLSTIPQRSSSSRSIRATFNE